MKRYCFVSLLTCLGLSVSAQAAIVSGADGINMGQDPNGLIYNMLILLPYTDFAASGGWAEPNQGFSQMVVSVGQLMGVFDDGSSIPYTDLVPLSTHTFRVTGPAGEILSSGSDGTVLSGNVTMTRPQGDISMGIYQ